MSKLIEDLEKDLNDPTIDKQFAVGALQGMWMGLSIAICLLMFGAAIPAVWHWSSYLTSPSTKVVDTAPKPFVTATAYSNVPFIPLSDAAVKYSLNKENARKLIEREMLSRWYFEQESLRNGTRYIPRLRVSNDVHSVITLANGGMKEVVVQLLNADGSPGRYGLIPFDEYEDDISEGNK
jgi:hypothetical protein